MAKFLGAFIVIVIASYFIIYPIIYFTYNYFIVAIGFPQYIIPGFWIGMLGYFLLRCFIAILK